MWKQPNNDKFFLLHYVGSIVRLGISSMLLTSNAFAFIAPIVKILESLGFYVGGAHKTISLTFITDFHRHVHALQSIDYSKDVIISRKPFQDYKLL
jgi:hypothetical protein